MWESQVKVIVYRRVKKCSKNHSLNPTKCKPPANKDKDRARVQAHPARSPPPCTPQSRAMGTHASDTLAPVFMRRDDGGSFKTMKSDQISAILKELELKLGRFEIGRMSIAAGGDLLIRPNSKTQQEELMKISKVLNYSIDVRCSLPNSYTIQRMISDKFLQETPTKISYKLSKTKDIG